MTEPDKGVTVAQEVKPPYGTILQELEAGMVVPFLGAAASRVGCVGNAPGTLPSGRSLSEALALDARFPAQDAADNWDLAKVSSYYVDGSSRSALRRKLRDVFASGSYKPNSLHRLLASVSRTLLIVTTNYDTLLEEAFKDAGKDFDVIVYPADNREYANALLWWKHGATEPVKLKSNDFDEEDLGKTTTIYKLHGSVRPHTDKWDNFVITEEDYIRFLSRMNQAVPGAFRKYFSTRFFLFLGYGLNDWNLRVLLREVGASEAVSWAILHQPSPFETVLWNRRKVTLFNVTLEEFVAEMEAELQRKHGKTGP